ncbi:bifunctional diaminohydroxyphosphoribosylaminopyrimidine deaminase/5-amino-6-(5-phosphoribosylamino)uracil reductase RibD [Endozoicomonas numazuensis]|uniref:bifunctional diaminohydroxyphosphoribosylaminopyrimidine deaminase/5-amino-6-(5-phosphoribosylamino)uracil reductase RibD n=1 Tax=Endozoicomonas numazuensis TaxID=1137799 RepID=UPI00068A335A|nr:bifunctional diaminohydroxyphosphoribosylaminopyrimidine deaminase/5-amino-6-(5-phosphoribosylamino)uracil reductase RibD [Endozoicomonas numazuensis]
MLLEQINSFMREALIEGRKARRYCSPNPPVGCVLVQNRRVVARGHTQSPGKEHAEAMALKQLPADAKGIVAFVTLEPCSFHGRTPSCAKALVERGIEEVYVGVIDPDARNSGKGIEILRQAGIKVTLGIASEAVAEDLDPFLAKTSETCRTKTQAMNLKLQC